MVRLNTPLLSMDAHGSIGDAVTFQSSTRRKFAREKPHLPYSLTLPQRYQRWLYEDYCVYWHTLTTTQKNVYRDAGHRFHRTAFQQFMSVMLATLPDIDAMYRLDYQSAGLYRDFSLNALHLTIIGASSVPGLIGEQAHFDGINDFLFHASDPLFGFTSALTIELFYTPLKFGAQQRVVSHVSPGNPRYYIYVDPADKYWWWVNDGVGGSFSIPSLAVYPSSVSLHLAVTLTNSGAEFFINGVSQGTSAVAVANFYPASFFNISGQPPPITEPCGGRVDHFIKYNRVLSDADILRHAVRRYQA